MLQTRSLSKAARNLISVVCWWKLDLERREQLKLWVIENAMVEKISEPPMGLSPNTAYMFINYLDTERFRKNESYMGLMISSFSRLSVDV